MSVCSLAIPPSVEENCNGLICFCCCNYFISIEKSILDEFLVGIRNFYTKDNCPSWWPKDVVFTPVTGMVRSAQPNNRCLQNYC